VLVEFEKNALEKPVFDEARTAVAAGGATVMV
jgi:hypothetical protein